MGKAINSGYDVHRISFNSILLYDLLKAARTALVVLYASRVKDNRKLKYSYSAYKVKVTDCNVRKTRAHVIGLWEFSGFIFRNAMQN